MARSLATALSSHPDWKRFLADYWERRPFLFRNVLARPLFSESALLKAYRRARDRQLETEKEMRDAGRASVDKNVIVYLEMKNLSWKKEDQATALIRLLPQARDKNCSLYIERILSQERCHGVAAQLRYNLQGYNPELLEPAEELTAELFSKTGYPGDWTLDSYLGQYENTAFGVHQDLSEDQLYISPVRPKTIYLWSEADWQSVENYQQFSFCFKNHPVEPLTFEIGPHDVAYWPRDYYHIGTSPLVTLSVQINMRPRTSAKHVGWPQKRVSFGYRSVSPAQVASRTSLITEARALQSQMAELIESKSTARTLLLDTLARQSARFVTNAFDAVEVPFSVKLPRDVRGATRFQLHTRRQLLWVEHDATLFIACNGWVSEFSAEPTERPIFKTALRLLQTGEAFSIEELASRVAGELVRTPRAKKSVPRAPDVVSLVEDLVANLHQANAIRGVA
jgi:hypothetical protein